MNNKLVLSNTQVGMYLRCPKQYEYRYVMGLKQPPSGALVQGSAYHGALEANFKQKIESGIDLPEGDVLDAYDTAWNKRVVKDDVDIDTAGNNDIDWEGLNPSALKDMGARVLKLYRAKLAPLITNPKSVEKKYSTMLDTGDEFIGIVDLETDTAIVDHKLKGKMMGGEEAKRELQPASYGLLTGKLDFEFHVGVKKLNPEVAIVPVTKSQGEVDWWKFNIETVAKAIKIGVFPANPTGFLCSKKFCGYWDRCKNGK